MSHLLAGQAKAKLLTTMVMTNLKAFWTIAIEMNKVKSFTNMT